MLHVGLFGMKLHGPRLLLECKRIGVDVANWPVLVADELVDARQGCRWAKQGNACSIRSWRAAQTGSLQIPRPQPSREPSDFADERAHRGYACDRSGQEWDSDLGVDCSIRVRSGGWVTGT